MGRKGIKEGFKPFVVASEEEETIFRVVEMDEEISREAITKILEKLPIRFSICKTGEAENFDSINEPLEVSASAEVIYIYPPKHRMISCTHTWSTSDDDLIRKMNFDNVMDMENPGHGQLRTCIHFDPKIFLTEWRSKKPVDEIEVDIHVYPEGKTKELRIEPPRLDVGELLSLIAGGEEKTLKAEQVESWEDLIMYAVVRMKYAYENPDVSEDDDRRLYYKPCWERIEAAGEDIDKLVDALEHLRSSIKWA